MAELTGVSPRFSENKVCFVPVSGSSGSPPEVVGNVISISSLVTAVDTEMDMLAFPVVTGSGSALMVMLYSL